MLMTQITQMTSEVDVVPPTQIPQRSPGPRDLGSRASVQRRVHTFPYSPAPRAVLSPWPPPWPRPSLSLSCSCTCSRSCSCSCSLPLFENSVIFRLAQPPWNPAIRPEILWIFVLLNESDQHGFLSLITPTTSRASDPAIQQANDSEIQQPSNPTSQQSSKPKGKSLEIRSRL
jgi:hypothetical protein